MHAILFHVKNLTRDDHHSTLPCKLLVGWVVSFHFHAEAERVNEWMNEWMNRSLSQPGHHQCIYEEACVLLGKLPRMAWTWTSKVLIVICWILPYDMLPAQWVCILSCEISSICVIKKRQKAANCRQNRRREYVQYCIPLAFQVSLWFCAYFKLFLQVKDATSFTPVQ